MVTTNSSMQQVIDKRIRNALAQVSMSLSPHSGSLALLDWLSHLAVSPGKQFELLRLKQDQSIQHAQYLLQCLVAGPGEEARACINPPAYDKRFDEPEWRKWPFNYLHQCFLLNQQWWEEASRGVMGVNPHHENLVAFGARQVLDVFSPNNNLFTNPVALKRTFDEGGLNLLRGLNYFIDNLKRKIGKQPANGTEDFIIGKDVAATPGKVVVRNKIMELIQYSPTTEKVHPEPILIVPAWIMKYYVLDLSEYNSLIKYLVDNGHTVFCISWKNPGAAERNLGMDDYLELGFYAAVSSINTIVPKQKIHAVGYCLGGTLLAIAAAAMARDNDNRLCSMALLAAQTEFSEPGELALFIDDSQVSMIEAEMANTGYLRADQMAGAFQMLRSYDLLWSRMVNEYLLGERRPMNDLMAWNADATRLPAKMHSQYLRRLFLNDDLSKGRYPVNGRPVSLSDIKLPTFLVGTKTDHVAPWKSVYKLHYLTTAEITFVLTNGGHNAGIVAYPGHPRRNYQVQTRAANGGYVAPEEWVSSAKSHDGSWWLQWHEWLKERSGELVAAPNMGASENGYKPICDAPGTYILEK